MTLDDMATEYNELLWFRFVNFHEDEVLQLKVHKLHSLRTVIIKLKMVYAHWHYAYLTLFQLQYPNPSTQFNSRTIAIDRLWNVIYVWCVSGLLWINFFNLSPQSYIWNVWANPGQHSHYWEFGRGCSNKYCSLYVKAFWVWFDGFCWSREKEPWSSW